MKRVTDRYRFNLSRWTTLLPVVLAIWMLLGTGPDGGGAIASGAGSGPDVIVNAGTTTVDSMASPSVTCPGGQCFTDVTSNNTFYTFINSLYQDNIIGGYPCGSTNEPCDSEHRPYYRPGNNVSRGQMAKFVDNGRRNIADAVGNSLTIDNPVGTALNINGTAHINDITGDSLNINGTAYISDTVANTLSISNTTGTALNITGTTSIAGPSNIIGPTFIDSGLGGAFYISTTESIAVRAETRSGGEAVYAECLQAGNDCYALEGYAPTGDYAGYMYGGKGVHAESDDASQSGVGAAAYGSSAYALHAESALYRGAYVKSDVNSNYSLYVDDKDGPSQAVAALNVRGTIRGEGDLIIGGSKAGYVVDIMQNLDSAALEPGDVVMIVGNGAPVLGQIPLVTVKKTTSAYDTGVVGIVDESWYAPDPATKAAYDKQQADWRAAMDQRNQATAAANASGSKPDLSNISMPDMTITDEQGTLHALPGVTETATGGYVSVVTLGSYKAVKVDASFGPIHAGDLLTSSPHAGYAMKATDRSQAFGATIGKALGDLDSGTGTIPVMVSLR